MKQYLKVLGYLVCTVAIVPSLVFAAQELGRFPITDAPQGTPGLGGAIRTATSIYKEQEERYDLIPLYLFEGKRFFAHGSSLGVHMFKNDSLSLDLVARYRFQRLETDEDFFRTVDERRQTVDGGLALEWTGSYGTLSGEWIHDLMGRHNGSEVDLSYRKTFDVGRFSFTPWVSYAWQDEDLVDYYFGVSPDEARPDLPVYMPGSAVNFGYGLNTTYYATDRISFFANVGTYGFDSKIHKSPLVEERHATAFVVGGAFHIGSIEHAYKAPETRKNEWSWRLNWGYAADGSIATDIVRGNVRRHDDIETYIGGVTISKLVLAGKRVDFYARLAIFRHFENDLQDDFFSFAPYIMAMGKGFVPWTDKLSFRYGFGMGVSYAERVPAIEQFKQSKPDDETSHLLNYLEFTVDFPLDRLSRRLKNCFAGVTVVHRSGIFSTSDILGNVSGGADYITGHVECLR